MGEENTSINLSNNLRTRGMFIKTYDSLHVIYGYTKTYSWPSFRMKTRSSFLLCNILLIFCHTCFMVTNKIFCRNKTRVQQNSNINILGYLFWQCYVKNVDAYAHAKYKIKIAAAQKANTL